MSPVNNQTTPVVILILNNEGYISYQAYVPSTYDNLNPNEFDAFLARVYNHVSYDATNALNNHTSVGKLLEVHYRDAVPVTPPNAPLCYFSTYINQNCNYKPIHVNSPILFNSADAERYSQIQTELCHMSCQLRYI